MVFFSRAQPGRATGYVDNVSDEQVVDLLKTAEATNYFLASKLTGSCRHLQVFLFFDMAGDEYMRFITKLYVGEDGNQGPPCLSSRIPKSVNNRCEYSLRNTGTVELPACSSSLYLSSFIPSSCLLWNSLPPDVSSCSSVSSFTLMLDSHFSFDRFTLGLS